MKKLSFSLVVFLMFITSYNLDKDNTEIQYIEITEADAPQFIVKKGSN
jgi:hypothetical protein